MPRFEWLRQDLAQILQEDMDSYWLCYQILNRLREVNQASLDTLEQEYGTGYGLGGGAHFRPDSAIAACLLDWPEHVEVRYLRGKDLSIGDIQGTGERMGLYRWRP